MKFGYEPWSDVLTFSFGSTAYVLQGAKHKRTRATRFRAVACRSLGGVAAPGIVTEEQLRTAGLWRAAGEAQKGGAA